MTKARRSAVAAKEPQTQAAAENVLMMALGRISAVAEQYPDLKANQNFIQLQQQLSDTEDQIAITRRVYNDTVQTYNTGIQVFPASVIANSFGTSRRERSSTPRPRRRRPPREPRVRREGNQGLSMGARGRRVARRLVALTALLVAFAAPAAARACDSGNVSNADAHLRLAPDASLLVTEVLTFDYKRSCEGSYRDVPLIDGARITNVQVSENGHPLRPAATPRSAAKTRRHIRGGGLA